ncbi:MAG: peptidoglycan-associated lipoprotein Pal [Cellvibrionaceae bacterium]
MITKAFKLITVLAFLSGMVVGCASTSDEEMTDTTSMDDSSVTTGTDSDSSLVTSVNEDPLAGVDTVFYFDFDQSVLKPASRAALSAHAEYLKGNSQSVRLEGHADERGTREYNMALGERRANAAADYLVLQGISRSRIETISYGEEQPARLGSSESSWSMNRRVELK